MHSQKQRLESGQRWTVGRVSTPLCRQPRTKLNYTLGAGDCQSQDVCMRTQMCMYMYVHVHRYIRGQNGQVRGRQGGGRHQLSWIQTQTRHMISPHPYWMAKEPAASCRRQGTK